MSDPQSRSRSVALLSTRKVTLNDPATNALRNYCINFVRTCKYTVFTFVPMVIYIQFHRAANIYFLLVAVFQCIPSISPVGYSRPTIMVPLTFVLFVTAVKEFIEDWSRRKQDKRVNQSMTRRLGPSGSFEPVLWKDIVVGDWVEVRKNEGFPADLVLFCTSEDEGLCYIETANLDGETNFKTKQALPSLQTCDTIEKLAKLAGSCECEAPNNRLYNFDGVYRPGNGDQLPLSNSQMLLRGCMLRNTRWARGLVVNTGRDTKIMRNQVAGGIKRSNIERLLNKGLLSAFFITLICCATMTTGKAIWGESHPDDWYLAFTERVESVKILLSFFTNLINMNGLIPISLYVSMEVVKLVQAYFMNNDLRMYQEETDTPCQAHSLRCAALRRASTVKAERLRHGARTSNLNEDLGQIDIIFSDKTGTLTQNKMELKAASIGGIKFGSDPARPDFETSNFRDPRLTEALQSASAGIVDFMRALSVCHSAVIEAADTTESHEIVLDTTKAKRQLQSSSPDDVAIVGGIGDHGFVFEGRSAAYINTTELGVSKRFELLHTLEFSSSRKRMSVIGRTDTGELLLYCKGADSVIKERLAADDPLLPVTWGHLEEYAVTGLRTLLVAKRVLRPELYAEWSKTFNAACCALEAREEKIEAASDAIERELHILGATAIEDKLQEGCAETIGILREAEVKIWMLTGDKQETAINIAKSCNLVANGMEILILNAQNKDEAAARLSQLVTALPAKRVDLKRKSSLAEHEHRVLIDIEEGTRRFNKSIPPLVASDTPYPPVASPGAPTNPRQPPVLVDDPASVDIVVNPPEIAEAGRSLVVDGGTLIFILEEDSSLKKPFLQLITQCASVVACRMSPLQKAQVVKLVRDNTDVITLAIGDGANDVSMITTAHIGVGISGQEGLQAMLASDYAISQFSHLQSLLLVHGRWSYRRIAELIVYSFYKNFTFVLGNVWFSFLTGFSGKLFYDDLLDGAYNMFFTGLPIVCYACMEQDVPAEVSLKTPKLYLEGLARHRFNMKVAVRWVLNAIAHSIIIFVSTLWLVQTGGDFVISEWDIGETMMALVITTVTWRLLLECRYITVIHALILPLSLILWFLLSQTRSELHFPDDTFVDVVPRLYKPFFWLGIVIVPMICLMRDFVFKFVKHNYNPRLTHVTKRDALKQERQLQRLAKHPETMRLNSESE